MDTAACTQRASINIREWILPMGLLQAEKPFWKHNSRATRHSDRAAPAAVPLLLARSNENAHHDWSQVALGEACDDLPEGRFQGVSVTAAVQRVADAAKWIATGPWRVYRFLSQECN